MIAGSKSLGTPIIDREHDTYHLNIDSIRTLWKNYYIPFVKGHYFSSVKYTSDSAKVGDVILYVGSSPAVYYTSDYVISKEGKKIPTKIDVLPAPQFQDGNKNSIQQGAGIAIHKSKNENTNLASIEFLKWITEEENNMELAIFSAYVPVKKVSFSYQKVKDYAKNYGSEIPDKILKTLEITMKQMEDSSFSAVPKITNGYEIGMSVGECLDKFSKDNREKLLSRLNKGENYDKLVLEFTSENKFMEFYNLLNKTLSDMSTN